MEWIEPNVEICVYLPNAGKIEPNIELVTRYKTTFYCVVHVSFPK